MDLLWKINNAMSFLTLLMAFNLFFHLARESDQPSVRAPQTSNRGSSEKGCIFFHDSWHMPQDRFQAAKTSVSLGTLKHTVRCIVSIRVGEQHQFLNAESEQRHVLQDEVENAISSENHRCWFVLVWAPGPRARVTRRSFLYFGTESKLRLLAQRWSVFFSADDGGGHLGGHGNWPWQRIRGQHLASKKRAALALTYFAEQWIFGFLLRNFLVGTNGFLCLPLKRVQNLCISVDFLQRI